MGGRRHPDRKWFRTQFKRVSPHPTHLHQVNKRIKKVVWSVIFFFFFVFVIMLGTF